MKVLVKELELYGLTQVLLEKKGKVLTYQQETQFTAETNSKFQLYRLLFVSSFNANKRL